LGNEGGVKCNVICAVVAVTPSPRDMHDRYLMIGQFERLCDLVTQFEYTL
jgi:hypothetical protein